MHHDRLTQTVNWSRRRLLSVGLVGFGGLHLPALLQAADKKSVGGGPAKHVIFLHQFGGPAHIDTFDMKPDAPEGIRGEFKPIASSAPGIQICEHLPRWAKLMHECALVRSVHHNMGSHNAATYYSLTGQAPAIDDIRLRDSMELFPAYGCAVSKLKPSADPAVPASIAFPHLLTDGSVTPGQHASFLGKQFDHFYVGTDPASRSFNLPELSLPAGTTVERLQDRKKLLEVIDKQAELLEWSATAQGMHRLHERALTMLLSPRIKNAFDLGREPAKLRDEYGRTTYGQSCLLARRLVEAGVRFVTVYFSPTIGGKGNGGWDTHQDNFNDLKKRLLPNTDRAVPALLTDLKDRGLLNDTLVVWMGEFGRAPKVGDRDAKGRNHWPHCYTVVLAGGGIRGGSVYGASDKTASRPALRPTKPDDISATMFWALGLDPHAEVIDPVGRPLPISRGKPLVELFG